MVEMIVRASCSNPRRQKKIRRVVKVKNPEEVVAKFERYRGEVMSWRSSKEHSRSIVDGNEVLQFYGTTMSCCSSRNRVLSKLCTDSGCRACRVIQSGFDTCYNKLHGIRVSSKSNGTSEDGVVNGAAKGAKRAVIICRTIAAGGGGGGGGGVAMVVPNPAALLPCFLVIFD